MLVVDTSVVPYLLIEGDATKQAQALWQVDPDWCSEPFFRIEFSNLLATQARAKALTVAQALSLLERAQSSVKVLSSAGITAGRSRLIVRSMSATIDSSSAPACHRGLRWPG